MYNRSSCCNKTGYNLNTDKVQVETVEINSIFRRLTSTGVDLSWIYFIFNVREIIKDIKKLNDAFFIRF